MGDGADRDRACPKASPIRGSIRRSTRLLAAIEAAPSASGWGAALVRYELLLLAELGFGLDLDSCAVSGAQRRSGRGQPALGPGGQRRGGRALCRQAAAAAALRSRGRAGELGRHRRRAGPDRPFPDARPADRPVGGARRCARAAGRAAAPGRRARLSGCLRRCGLRLASARDRPTRSRCCSPTSRRPATSRCGSRSAISPNSPTRRPSRWFWSYHVRIENGSERAVQLLSRSWTHRRRPRHGPRGAWAKAWSAKCR